MVFGCNYLFSTFLIIVILFISPSFGKNRGQSAGQANANQLRNKYGKMKQSIHDKYCRAFEDDDLAYDCVTYHMSPECFNLIKSQKAITKSDAGDNFNTDGSKSRWWKEQFSFSQGLELGQFDPYQHDAYYECLKRVGILTIKQQPPNSTLKQKQNDAKNKKRMSDREQYAREINRGQGD